MIPLKDENPTTRRPIVTLAIIAICVGVYFFWQPSPFGNTDDDLLFNLEHAAVPCEITQGEPLTIDELRATYGGFGQDDACEVGSEDSEQAFPGKSVWLAVLVSMFLHGSILHLAGNVLFLWIFGNNIEDRLGHVKYLAFYLVGGAVATGAHVLLDVDSTIAMVGASGAIAAVMGAYLVWFPDAPVRTLLAFFFILVVRVKAKYLLLFWFVLQFFTAPDSGVAWAAHVGGFVFGALVGLLARSSRMGKRLVFARDHREDPWDPTGGAGYDWYDRD